MTQRTDARSVVTDRTFDKLERPPDRNLSRLYVGEHRLHL